MRTLRRSAAGLVALALLLTAAGCDWPAGTRYVDTVFADVDATTDVVYRTTTTHAGDTVELRMDIYEPRGDTARERPTVMWMFGGGWIGGERQSMTDWAVDSARRGYVGVTIDYRIRPEGGNQVDMAGDAYEDAVAAVRWLKDNAGAYGIDPEAVIAGGYSAGAVNAMNLLYWPGERGPVPASTVAGGVSIAGLSMGAPAPGDPPGLMHHGDADNVVPHEWGRTTCDNALAADDHCTFFTYPGAGHLVAYTHAQQIRERTAEWIFEQVLYPMGYRPDEPSGT